MVSGEQFLVAPQVSGEQFLVAPQPQIFTRNCKIFNFIPKTIKMFHMYNHEMLLRLSPVNHKIFGINNYLTLAMLNRSLTP